MNLSKSKVHSYNLVLRTLKKSKVKCWSSRTTVKARFSFNQKLLIAKFVGVAVKMLTLTQSLK